MEKRITILGMGISAIERRWDIMRYCEGTDIWGLNDGLGKWSHIADKFARWFILYNHDYLQRVVAERRDWMKWADLNALGIPIVTFDYLPQIKNQYRYPSAFVFKNMPSIVMLGSPALMLALAVAEGATYIQSYGIDQQDAEHRPQRASWAYWCAVAQARGIQLGGTAMDWALEDTDIGMAGRREAIRKEIEQQGEGNELRS